MPPESAPVPRALEPSLKATVPVTDDGETVAVKVMVSPGPAEVGEAVRRVVVETGLT